MTQTTNIESVGEQDPAILEWAKAIAEAPAEARDLFFRAVGLLALEQEAA